jgi:hypothetical protein
LHKIYALVDICDPERQKQYWKSYHCANVVVQEGTKLNTGLCRKRWCIVCQRKKTAELLNGYTESLQALQEEEQLFIVTLTAQNIKALRPVDLRNEFKVYNEEFKRVKDSIRKTHKLKTNGFKKLECTFNMKSGEYHPHMHLIIQGKEQADLVVKYWIKQMKKRYGRNKVSRKGQDIAPIGNTEKDYIEVFKYATKGSVKDTFEAVAEDLMIEALEGLQVFKPIGSLRKVKQPKEETTDTTKADWIESKTETYVYDDIEKDYISASYERLIGTQEIEKLIEIQRIITNNSDNEEENSNGYRSEQTKSGKTSYA